MVNELGDLQLAGWWVGQSSLRVTAGYERERTERLDEAREPEAVTKGYRRTTECSTHAVFWAVGVVPRELKSLRSSEKPHANRRRTELRLGSRARLSPSTRGTNRAADGAGGAGWRSGRGTPCRTGHPRARSPGASPVS